MSPWWVVPAFVASSLVPGTARPQEQPFVDADALIRRVVKSQRLSEDKLSSYTFDQIEVATKFAKDGRAKETATRLFYVFSGDKQGEALRELVTVNGRAATLDEKAEAAEEDAKGRRKRLERRAATKARTVPVVSGEEDDPFIGARRLSDVLARYEYRITRQEIHDGRLCYVLHFFPRPGLKSKGVSEQALSSLAGEVLIDATDFQIRSVDAVLVSPVKVAGGIAARVDDAAVSYEAQPLTHSRWFPCVIDLRVKGKTAIFIRLDTGYRFQFSNFRTFAVETETASSPGPQTIP